MCWIENIERFCVENEEFRPYFKNFISLLYKQDIGAGKEPLGKEVLLEWAQKRKLAEDEVYKQFYLDNQEFIKFVKGDFGSSSDESGSESESESESESQSEKQSSKSDEDSDSEYEDVQQ